MEDKVLYGYTGLFDTPDDIIHAAESVAEKGYEKYDVHTPYPVHGMDNAMKLGPSKLAYFSLVFGLLGTISALILMYWTNSIDYPVIVGGKPFFSFPAYVPIMFEVTVLAAAIMTVTSLVVIFFKFPNLSHPLHDTSYMKAVSSDRYGVCIEAIDKKFNEDEVKSLFESLGAQEIKPIYYDSDEIGYKNIVLQPKFLAFLTVVFVLVSGTTYVALNKLMFMVPYNWMREQEKIIPQEKATFFADGFNNRKPVSGTVARGDLPYLYKGEPDKAGKLMVNPLLPTKENLNLGKTKFNIYCSPCHGYLAEGDSRLRGQFPNPPTLHSKKVREWSDGRIYAVVMDGQNVMPSYASQLNYTERWATILYIRALQRSFNAKESDVK